MRLVTKKFSNMLVFSRAKMRLVVSQPKIKKQRWDWLFKKINLVWKNMNLPRRFLFKHICTSHMTSLFLMSHFSTFQILSPLTRSSSSPHLLYFLPFSRSIFSSFSSLFPFLFFFYRAYSNFLLHLLLCLFLLNEWSLHVTNFVVLWFSSHSLSLSLKIHENEEKVQDIQQCLIPVCNTIFGRNGKISPKTPV